SCVRCSLRISPLHCCVLDHSNAVGAWAYGAWERQSIMHAILVWDSPCLALLSRLAQRRRVGKLQGLRNCGGAAIRGKIIDPSADSPKQKAEFASASSARLIFL